MFQDQPDDLLRQTEMSMECQEVLSADVSLRKVAAGNPATPSILLGYLATDRTDEVRQVVADNPNTPWTVLEQLAWEFPHAFLSNSVGTLQLMAHPEQINTDEIFWAAVLREAMIPDAWWSWLQSHPLLKESQAVRQHVRFAGEITHGTDLAQHEEHTLLLLAELLLAASAQEAASPVVRQSETTYERDLLRQLAQEADIRVKKQIARSPHTSAEILHILAQCVDEEGFDDEYREVREAVGSNEQTSVETLSMLAQDEEFDVRIAVAQNTKTPPELLETLAEDAYYNEIYAASLLGAVAGNKRTLVSSLKELALADNHTDDEGRDRGTMVRASAAENENVPEEVLSILAQCEDEMGIDGISGTQVRGAVAANPRTPAGILAGLATDREKEVRSAVASNRQTPAEVLATLALDQEEVVRQKVASHPQLPVEALVILARDQDAHVRWKVTLHPQLPIEMLITLAQSQDVSTRRGVASHPLLPVEMLVALAWDQDVYVRREVALHPQLPAKVLGALAQDQDAGVRMSVVGNEHTSENLLHVLAQDSDTRVQWMVHFVQRLMDALKRPFRQELWWKALHARLRDNTPSSFKESPVEEQMSAIVQLVMPEQVHESIFAILAMNWDATAIGRAFAISTTDIDEILRLRREHSRLILAPFMPAVTLQKLAASSAWEIRYLIALSAQTPLVTRLHLCQDGNRYVRAMARAKVGSHHFSGWPFPPDARRDS